ncbi:hypothetical protein GCM10010329_63190 [Streptomyces spiroverticillatus]|nr:hypothetical protein GCM10010329_63190 [Streptomyces spiroverticillatus]
MPLAIGFALALALGKQSASVSPRSMYGRSSRELSVRMPRRRRFGVVSSTVGLALVLGFGVHALWRGTDVLGREDFCQGALTSAEASALLDGRGRLTEQEPRKGQVYYVFTCTVERTSLSGAPSASLSVRPDLNDAGTLLESGVWGTTPSTYSYFTGDVTGSVSENHAWVQLPRGCLAQEAASPGSSTVSGVRVTLSEGSAPRPAMAQAALRAAQHVARRQGCADRGLQQAEPRIQGPAGDGGTRPTDPGNACGVKGFRLAGAALLGGAVKPGTERFTGRGTRTWGCDLFLEGPGSPQVTFAVSKDPRFLKSLRPDEADRRLTHRPGLGSTTCYDQNLYVDMSYNDAYQDLAVTDRRSGRKAARKRGAEEPAAERLARESLFVALVNAVDERSACGGDPRR